MTWSLEIDILRRAGVALAPGLTAGEIVAVEDRLSAKLPPDLRELLVTVLPVGERFPNWRALDHAELEHQLSWPFQGIAFDIEHNGFWWKTWGPRPSTLREAIALARKRFSDEPILVPLHGHRYLPVEPSTAGNPVLSVYQTDVIYYGTDLRDYVAREFASGSTRNIPIDAVRRIRFWSDLIDCAGDDAPQHL